MIDQDRKSDQPDEAPRYGLRRPDAEVRGEVNRPPEPKDAENYDVYPKEVASDQLAEDTDALRERVLGEADQRSRTRLDTDRGYGAGHAARDARAQGSALDEDGDNA